MPQRFRGTLSERLLSALVDAQDERGDITRTLGELAAAIDTSVRQVRRCVGELRDAGLLVVAREAQACGRYSPRVYRLAGVPVLDELALFTRPEAV